MRDRDLKFNIVSCLLSSVVSQVSHLRGLGGSAEIFGITTVIVDIRLVSQAICRVGADLTH